VSRTSILTVSAAAVIGAGVLGATPATAVPAPTTAVAAPTTAVAAKKSPKNALKVLTLNLYLGGSLNPAIEALQNGGDFYGEVRKLYATVQATNFPLRAAAIAKTIKTQNPDIITLNELSNWIVVKDEVNAGLRNYDYLKIMRKALKKEGLSFKVASLVENAKIPPFAGLPYVNPDVGCDEPPSALEAKCALAFRDRDAVLYNTKTKALKPLKDKASGNFKKQVEYSLAGVPVSFNRGWASRAFSFRGTQFTMMTSHLEVESGNQGTTGMKNWPSPIQVAQGKELVKQAKKQAKKTNGRVVLAGDFNSDANGYYSPTYKNMTKYFEDSYLQAGGEKGKSVGATCCHLGTLDSDQPLDSGDPVVPTRIDLVLTRKATGVWSQVIENKLQDTQPKWQSDHYFYAAAVKLK
jgi:Endonuclease/Exonuclease/phosphatase family